MSQRQSDRTESSRNPYVPGVRVIRRSDAFLRYDNASATLRWHYPLSEVNDLGLFAYVEKRAGTDADRPWARQAHPDVNLYMYVLRGAGTVVLGDDTFAQETYDYGEGDLVVVPRGVAYTHTGDWDAIFCHARVGVFGTVAGTHRFPHPVLTLDKPPRPTQRERDALAEPGTYTLLDPTGSRGVLATPPWTGTAAVPDLLDVRTDLAGHARHELSLDQLYDAVTPIDEQTADSGARAERRTNPTLLGSRVLRRGDAPAVLNAAGGNKKRGYPLGWTDDMAIFHISTHTSTFDTERPADSSDHPDVEEYKFIIEGSGTCTFGRGDPTFEDEAYDFQQGDLVITPRGVPHFDAGDYTTTYFHTKTSAFGKTPGTAQFPHPAHVRTKPPRPTEEERALLQEVGTYILMDSREKYNVIQPNPILRIEDREDREQHLRVLRPDLFPGTEA